ncbi:MAG: LPS assembly protein LptD, partial [Gammaproteobacteria bacterium]
RGKADKVEKVNASITRLQGATYSTCPAGRKDWELRAQQVELDQATGEGRAKDVTLRLGRVPVLYAPSLSFPIDDRRKSGFLAPSIGNSSTSGAEIGIPYYWNIAPNRDATVSARVLSKRGLQLGGEYRYLTSNSRGTVSADYLPNDRVYGQDRYLFAYRQQGHYASHWRTDVDFNQASDTQYFQDLGSSLSTASATSLDRRVDLRYDNGPWSALARLQSLQQLGATAEPYARLPQLLVRADLPDPRHPLTYHLYGEAVRFAPKDNAVNGTRLDLYPGLSLNLRGASWFATPTISVRHTQYALDNTAPGAPSDPSRTTPIFSLDSGVYFDRDVHWGGRSLIQTLEPRLYYLYVPYRNQSQLPVFDTTSLDFSFQQLFRPNRFVGADRQGDANQLTLALTSRFLDPRGGRELLRASLGEIVYFRHREVTLPAGSPATGSRSDVVGEVAAALARHATVSATLQWDPTAGAADRSVVRYHYQPDRQHIVNVEYRYRRDLLKQTDISALWPLGRRWNGIARWNYSLQDRRTLEAIGGVEYDSCCWALRLVARRYVTADQGKQNTAIYLQLVLKGLTSVGRGVDDLLEHGILGYGSDLYTQ